MESVAFVMTVVIVYYNAKRFWKGKSETVLDQIGITKQNEMSATLRNISTTNCQDYKE